MLPRAGQDGRAYAGRAADRDGTSRASAGNDCFGRYVKYSAARGAGHSHPGCSPDARLSEDGRSRSACAQPTSAAAGPVPCRCPETESAFAGAPCTEETAREFARAAVAEISPRDSWRASRAFRLHVAEECAFRALCESVERAGGRL
ncbi:MAG: hypothetical protein ACLTSG_07300 [Lachnospiraceae bacterium]